MLKQTETVSKCDAHSAGGTPVATAAFQSRAPSKCVATPFECAQWQIAATLSSEWIRPPPRLWVFSSQTSLVAGVWTSSGRNSPSSRSRLKMPCSPSRVRQLTPESAAGPPASQSITCEFVSQSISSPGRQCKRTAIWFDMQPDGTNSAASFPSRAATCASSVLIEGSSP